MTRRPLVFLLALTFPFVAAQAKTLPALLTMTPAQIKASGIALTGITPTPDGQSLPFSAQVVPAPDAEWMITAPLDGVVTRLRADEGSAVVRGTTLLDLQAPSAPLLAAEWTRHAGSARLAIAERDRDRSLHAEGIIPARRLQASEQKAQEMEAARDASSQQLRLLGVSVAEARSGALPLRAPGKAIVVSRLVSLGQRVSAGDALIRLADPSRLALTLHVPINASQSFQRGDVLKLSDATTDAALIGVSARVTQVGWGTTDQNSSSVTIRASLEGGSLRPGQWLRVRQTRSLPQGSAGWQLPRSAVLRHDGQSLVFVRVGEGFRPVSVTPLGEQSGQALLTGALQANDRVAISGLIALKSLLQAGGQP